MQHIGEPTVAETIAYYDEKIGKLNREKAELKAKNQKFLTVLDELCANAEPVCDSLEIGQPLKSPKTLADFRKALDAAWAALPEVN